MAKKHRLPIFRVFAAAFVASLMLSLTACANFFICQKSSCTTSTSSTASGDYLYVANSTSGSTYINGYDVSAGKLTALTGFPYNLTFVPVALTVSPNNGFLYAASAAGLIYAYSIGSAGALTPLSGGAAVESSSTGFSSIDISPDGNYLYALDSVSGSLGTLYQFPLSTSTGLPNGAASFGITTTTGTIVQQSVKVSPNGNFVVCSLGTGGDVVFPYSSTLGITNQNFASIATGSTLSGDFGIAMDTANHLYVARTTGVAVYALTLPSSTTVTVTTVTEPSLTFGNGPHGIVLSNTAGAYVYVGNTTDGTISEYSSSSGTLAAVSGSPVSGPNAVATLGRDNTGKYIVAAGYNSSSGLQIFTIGSTGGLTLNVSAGTGASTSIPTPLALTHSQ